MEKGLKRKKDGVDPDDPEDQQAGPSLAEQVTVKFKNNDDRWKKTQATSYKSLVARCAEESWTEYSWHDKNSTFSEVCFIQTLISVNTNLTLYKKLILLIL